MNTLEINSFVGPFNSEQQFKGTFPCDKLPSTFSKPAGFIINLSPAGTQGTHWVALYIDDTAHGSYFDSYGFKPLVKDVRHFISKHCRTVTCNEQQLQHIQSNICGRYVTVFIIITMLHKMPMDSFVNGFSKNTVINDIVINNKYNHLKQSKQL